MVDRAFAHIDDGSSFAATIDLNGTWQFRATDETEWMEALVPGSVYTDLLRADRLEDPYYRDNEFQAQWVARKDWEYRRDLKVDEGFLRHDKVLLDCRGLDTIAQVYVNGVPVAGTENMFVEYEFDVKPLLRVGDNAIHVILRSVLDWCRRKDSEDPRVTWMDQLRSTRNKGYSAFLRKEACEFGWDWGLRLIRCGIWRPIRLVSYDTARITGIGVRQDLSDPARAILHTTTEVERYRAEALALELSVALDGQEVSAITLPVHGSQVEASIAIEAPRLWWPNGWGEQPLYTVTATLRNGEDAVHSKRMRIGLRTVELLREKDARGERFGFKVNGHLIFCKGANWVPADALPERLTADHYNHLLQSCVDAHMNMLRVWGGGRYEADVFYDLCDEHGLMIWHDFMFAEGPYLTAPDYLANVRAEIRSVVRRLRHHPSIVLWCGNNESESNMARGHHWLQFESATWQEYEKIFEDVIPQTTARYAPDRPYWPSSPHHPLDRERRSPDWETASGDAHVWEAWHKLYPFSWYNDVAGYRFVSEFGHQSLPAMETVRAFTRPEDRYLNSPVMEHHQKVWRDGTSRIAFYVTRMFRLPARFEDWVYLSQLVHGEGTRIGTEAFRRNFPNTTGALYWQLDNNWPAFSGCSIDYYGRWKALHYMARRFFSPVLVSGLVEGTRVKIWGVNDHLHDVPAVLAWSLQRFDGQEVCAGEKPVVLPATSSTVLAGLDFESQVGEHPDHKTDRKESYENRRNYYLVYKLFQGDQELNTNISFFAPPKFLRLYDPALGHTIAIEHNRPVVTVTAERFAAYVELGLQDGYARFSDNYFHLLPGEARRIEVLDVKVLDGDLAKQFYARSLVNTYR